MYKNLVIGIYLGAQGYCQKRSLKGRGRRYLRYNIVSFWTPLVRQKVVQAFWESCKCEFEADESEVEWDLIFIYIQNIDLITRTLCAVFITVQILDFFYNYDRFQILSFLQPRGMKNSPHIQHINVYRVLRMSTGSLHFENIDHDWCQKFQPIKIITTISWWRFLNCLAKMGSSWDC